MKNKTIKMLGLMTTLLLRLTITNAQESNSTTKNPFPLDEKKKELLLKEFESTIRFYKQKYDRKTLDQWPKAARDSFLLAKAKKINILFVPNYYREYNTSPTIETIKSTQRDPIYPDALLYKVTFHTDTLKEKLVSKKLIYVTIWNIGEVQGFIVPVYNDGPLFSPPGWEDERYADWKSRNFSPYSYITGYENMSRETLSERFKRLQKEKQEEIDRKKNKE